MYFSQLPGLRIRVFFFESRIRIQFFLIVGSLPRVIKVVMLRRSVRRMEEYKCLRDGKCLILRYFIINIFSPYFSFLIYFFASSWREKLKEEAIILSVESNVFQLEIKIDININKYQGFLLFRITENLNAREWQQACIVVTLQTHRPSIFIYRGPL